MNESESTPPPLPAAAIARLRAARRIVALTGAGVSAESGVPTFRDAQTGLWSRYRPEDLATPEAFLRDPKLVWEWYAMRRARVREARPNAAHFALAEIERRTDGFLLATQNVDGLHQRAGSRNVVELHGNLTRARCSDDQRVVERWQETGEIPPRCPRCGGLLRPDVVWFHEPLPEAALARAHEASRRCDLFLSVGTSSLVHPAAGLPLEALAGGATVIEVNPDVTPLTPRAHHRLQGPAGAILPALVRAAWPGGAGAVEG